MWLTDAWLGQTEGPLAVAPGFIPTACTVFLGTYSLWMDILLSLDIVGRALDLPQSNVPYSVGMDRSEVRGKGRRGESGNSD